VTTYASQDAVISTIYIYKARNILTPSDGFYRELNRPIFHWLVFIMVFTVGLDLAVMSLTFAGLYSVETTFRAAAYGLKLRLEFVVLNQLIKAVQRKQTYTRAREASHSIGWGINWSLTPAQQSGRTAEHRSVVAGSASDATTWAADSMANLPKSPVPAAKAQDRLAVQPLEDVADSS
jgi:hypothetical protein